MSTIAVRLKDQVFISGLLMLFISLFVFLLPLFNNEGGDTFAVFGINFVIAAIYFIIVFISGRFKKFADNLHITSLFLILALISAYSLNREMNIFENSATWLCVLLVISSINYIAFAFIHHLPVIARHLMCFILGISTIVFIYLSIYLIPYYAIGIGAFFLLGISLHTFVPLALTIFSFGLVRRTWISFPKGLYSFGTGVLLVLVIVVVFITKWNNIVATINNEYRKELIDGDAALPAWVRISAKMEAGPITEKVLKTDLVYSMPVADASFMRMPQRNFSEPKKHDPLVMLSAMTTERVQLSNEEKINILKSLFDSRHQAEQRLWSGENLTTDHVHTKLKMWPSLRMAYTEKIITVTNNNRNNWAGQEEGIYTFHLPEGGVVTSLSLWIDGKEEKAILTSKAKAANAYNTIVGIEKRDPSVIHWQEGNRVSVRVFPVLPGESRIFKVGITSPLAERTGDLVYDNIWFDGPSFSNAKEDIKVDVGNAANIIVPSSFNKQSPVTFNKKGKYNASWNLSCAVQPLTTEAFSFDNKIYSVTPYNINRQPAFLQQVFLDVNGSWTYDDFYEIWDIVKNRKVYVYREGALEEVTEANKGSIFSALTANRFSLFPFYKVKHPEQAVIISKSGSVSPNMEDLEGSDFLRRVQSQFNPANKYRLFNLDRQLSPYLASLHEKRYFNYEAGTVKTLKEIMQENMFAVQQENADEVIIHQAAIKLVREEGSLEQSTAPDHLMRLFTYNHIMQQLGENPVGDEMITDQLTEAARQSYIVTPLTSLVVLESQKDYDRFDIKDKTNSLKNASMKSTGAVPEPHEWALIILTILVILYVKYPHLFKRFVWKA